MSALEGVTAKRTTLGRGVLVNLVGIAAKVSRPLYLLLFSRVLGVETFGLYMLAFTVQETVSKVAILGLNWGSMRVVGHLKATGREREIHPTVRRILLFTLLSSTVTALLLALGADLVGEAVLGRPGLARPLRLFCLGMPALSGMFVLTWSYRPSLDMRYELYVRSIIEPTSVLVVGAVLLGSGWGLDGAVTAHVIGSVVGFLAALWFFARLFPLTTTESAHLDLPMLHHSSAGMGGMEFLTTLKRRIDLLVLARFLPLTYVGIYGAVIEISTVLTKARMAFDPILMPIAQKLLLREEREELREQLAIALGWSLQIGLLIFGVICLAPDLFISLFGRDFATAGAGLALIILSAGQLFHMSLGLTEGVLAITGFAYVTLVNMVVLIAMSFLLLLLLVPSLGMAGAALATASSYVFVTTWRYLQARRLLGINPLAIDHGRIVVAGVVSLWAAVLWLRMSPEGAAQSGSQILLFVVVFAVLLSGGQRRQGGPDGGQG